MLKRLLRVILRYQLIAQIKAERPELKRLSGMVLLKRYVENRLAEQERQQTTFESSIANPSAYGGLIQYPQLPSKLLVKAMDYLPLARSGGQGSSSQISGLIIVNGSLCVRGFIPPKPIPLGPLAMAVKSLNFWEKRLIIHQEAASRGEYPQPGMIDFVRFKIAESKEEIQRLNQQRSQ